MRFYPFIVTGQRPCYVLLGYRLHSMSTFKLEAPSPDPYCNKAFILNAVDVNAPRGSLIRRLNAAQVHLSLFIYAAQLS